MRLRDADANREAAIIDGCIVQDFSESITAWRYVAVSIHIRKSGSSTNPSVSMRLAVHFAKSTTMNDQIHYPEGDKKGV